jgi:2,5-diamino-6-(ribosylamino)-4(3H)-pyrimidinone 5'-phosphate reductase
VRVVVDSLARTPPGAAVLHRGAGVRIIACSRKADPRNREALAGLARVVVAGEEQVDLEALLGDLSGMGIRRLIVEGGGTLIWALISLGLVDEFCSFVGNLVIGGGEAPTPVDGTGFTVSEGFPRLTLVSADRVDQGILLRWKPERA